ncbi:hypothetical protein JCM10213_007784 [Rhodosporidiobolus nylandii]
MSAPESTSPATHELPDIKAEASVVPDAAAAAIANGAAGTEAPAAGGAPPDSNLIDEDGELSDDFYAVLKAVFLRFAKESGGSTVMGREELDAFAQATNGQNLGDDSYNEIVEYLDVTDKKELTFKGFTQLYSLQTSNDHSETIHDLEAWGYDAATLKLTEKKAGEGEDKKAEETKA